MLCTDNCLETVNPRLAREWHPTKNGTLTPGDVAPYSNRKVWWKCKKDHEWEATIANRNKGRGCPYCGGKAACKDNCLETVEPALAEEWHPTKNMPLTPRDVTPGSGKKVWWLCTEGHEWLATIYSRNAGNGCPHCHRRRKIPQ